MIVAHVPEQTVIETAAVIFDTLPPTHELFKFWREAIRDLGRGCYSVQQRDGKWRIITHV